jgi:predicted enzyme related to lactoylglutathione lyase
MNEPTLTHATPILQVTNLQRALDFYGRVMGFETAWTWGTPPDRASVCRDAVEIMIEVEREPRSSHVYLQVIGVDAYFEKVTGAGAKIVVPLADRAYGMRDGRVTDPDGNHLGIGEALPAAR